MISVLDTTVCDNNLGNQIIMDSLNKYLRHIFGSDFFIKLPYLDRIGVQAVKYMNQSEYVFLGGTNALSSEMEKYKQIGIDHENYQNITEIILAGVGWWQYQGPISDYTKEILTHCLHPNVYHSVRDSYTQKMLSTIGINNVLMTGCPTLWQLTEEHCRKIKKSRSDNVLLTFTNYSQDKSDSLLFEILQSNYKNIYAWVQGPEDLEYARGFGEEIEILAPDLNALDNLLASDIELDYVGTRCHAGIRAMQHQRRSIIIGVDNRAIEMQKDFNLPVVARTQLNLLPQIINSPFETNLKLPYDTINQWLGQYGSNCKSLPAIEPASKPQKTSVVKPVSRAFGSDRGTPIDRYYIENFLRNHAAAIQGRVLEIADNAYTLKFGSGVTHSDILNAVPSGDATIVGDLTTGENIPESAFDCIILTQTLHVTYDIHSTILNCMKALKPGGTLLLTVPGISQISRYDMDRWGDYWRFTDKSLKTLLSESVPEDMVDIQSYGNIAVAKAFLDGLALEELDQQTIDHRDDDYQVLLTAKVCKPAPRKTESIANTCQRAMSELQSNAPMILIYHRVADDPVDSQLLAVSPENFEGHLQELVDKYRVVPLHQILAEALSSSISPNTVALTFDDGYADNLISALPLLEKYGLHATIFITSGMIGSDREFWWDALERIFVTSPNLPFGLKVAYSGGTFDLGLTTPQERLKAMDELSAFLKEQPHEEIAPFIDSLYNWAGITTKQARPSHLIVNTEQLKKLSASPSIEIGSHTITHTRLSSLSPEKQRYEIRHSREQIENIIKKPVRLLSYPFGARGDYSSETMRILDEERYEAGIANIQDSIKLPIDLYSVPRKLVRNWSRDQFSAWLRDSGNNRLEAGTLAGRSEKIMSNMTESPC